MTATHREENVFLHQLRRTIPVLAALALLAGVAAAQGIEISPGQKVTGGIEEPWEIAVFRFFAYSNDTHTLGIKADKTSGLDLEVRLYETDGREVPLPPVTGGKLKAVLDLEETGFHYLVLRGRNGTTGGFQLAWKTKIAKPEPEAVNVPGNLDVPVRPGAIYSAKVKARKGTDLEPGIEALTSEGDVDHLDRSLVSEKGSQAAVKNHPLPLFGGLDLELAARAGSPAIADVSWKMKAGKPAVKAVGPDDLLETFCARIRSKDGDSFRAMVSGAGVTGVTLLQNLKTPGTPLPRVGDDEWELVGDDGDFPAAYYTLRVTFAGGRTQDFHFSCSGSFPSDVSVTDVGEGPAPTITWQGGDDADAVYLGVVEPTADEDLYSVLLPGGTVSHTLPAGVIPEGWPVEVEVWAFDLEGRIAVGDDHVGGGNVDFIGAVSIGDLLTYRLNTNNLHYDYEILEPVSDSGSGTLVHEPGWGGYVFRAGDEPDDPYVVILPGSLILGGTEDGNLFAALPVPSGGYDIDDFTGVYNFLQFSCAAGGDCEADYGTFRVNADSTFEAWIRSDAEGTPLLTGDVADSGDGYYVATVNVPFVGPVHFANVMVHEGASGRLLVIDLVEQSGIFDGGIVLGVEQQPLTPGAYDGVYNFLGSAEEGLLQVEIEGGDLDDGEELIRLRYDWPWTGFVGAGNPGTEGGVGLLSPDGIFYLGVWFEDTPGDYVSEIGAAIRR